MIVGTRPIQTSINQSFAYRNALELYDKGWQKNGRNPICVTEEAFRGDEMDELSDVGTL